MEWAVDEPNYEVGTGCGVVDDGEADKFDTVLKYMYKETGPIWFNVGMFVLSRQYPRRHLLIIRN